jgi:HEAT repeat protein
MDERSLSGLPDFNFDPAELDEDRSGEGGGAPLGEPDPAVQTGTPDALSAAEPGATPADEEAGLLELEAEVAEIDAEAEAEANELAREIKEFFVSFVKTIRASQLYVQGNPLLHKFVADLNDRLASLWGSVESVNFTIYENEIHWHDHPVYKGRPGGHENLAFQLYKDGIRRLQLNPGVEDDELRRFIDILRLSRTLKAEEEDLLTLMWNADFTHLRYEYVDVLGDEPPLPPGGGPDVETTGELPVMPELELSADVQPPTLREDFEPSLYFLDEADVAHLQQELLREWDRPVKRDVMLAVLDQYELGDEERRAEIMGILRQMLPRVLAEGEFGDAAFIVSELKGIAEKKGDPGISEQVEEVVGELSEPIVLYQLVRVLEDGSIDPKSQELATLLDALRPQAIEVLIQAVPTVTRLQAREQLLATMDRLASMNPQLMASLVRSDDPRVAAETARIAARLKMAGTAEAIASLLRRPSAEVRLAAVESLVSLRTSTAGSALLKALEDDSREVRVAAARGLADLKYRPAAQKLEGHVKGKELLKRDLTEQLAFFEAYARTAGEEAARLLGQLLNGRRFLWMKHPGRVRACAARALGLLSSGEAHSALATAEGDKDAMVASAVHQALRGSQGRER